MSLFAALAIAACAPGALAQTFVKPSLSPTQQNATNYVGLSNGTIVNPPHVPGKAFDRFITIMMENTDFDTAAGSATFQKLASKGILFSDYYAITHPSMPNYIAAVSGSTQGSVYDDSSTYSFPNAPASIPTIATLLDNKNVSWAAYMENMPTVGFEGVNYASHNYVDPTAAPGATYSYYVRRHSGLMKFDSTTTDPYKLSRHRNFNNFAEDLNANALPQWVWITPNIMNDAHDSNIDFVSDWLEYWLVPLLDNPNFNNDRTLIILTWDECAGAQDVMNQIYTMGLGKAVPAALHNTTDNTTYNHYSSLSTVEDNWNLGNMGQGDVTANVYEFLAEKLGHSNVKMSAQPPLPSTDSPSSPSPSSTKPTYLDALKTVQPLSDLQKLPSVPCARYALLFGIVSGTSVGCLRFLFNRKSGRRANATGWDQAAVAANWAVAAWGVGSLGAW
ncbi:hypothetical protein RQP46_001620 [Phenoliferia psychrophenolica]